MAIGIGRRQFISALGGATVAWPLAARAQQPAVPVIGFLGIETPEVFAPRTNAFRQGLSEAGYIEGRNVAIAFQWAGGNYDLLRTLADELVRQKVAVLVAAGSTLTARAAKAATATIPVVFYIGGDPVALGLVASLNQPGGNLTGVSGLSLELMPKRLELLHEALPAATSVAVLINPSNLLGASPSEMKDMQDSAHSLGLELRVVHATTEREFEAVFLDVLELRAGGLVIAPDPLFVGRGEQLGALSLRHRVPTISAYRDFVAAGGLMGYGGSLTDMFRLVGLYTGRILKGEKPADMPVQQSTKLELIINLKTAKVLDITIPLPLLGRADEVIE
jgi:putative tryptophan/tyrosine transport system substrate-binding protein